MRLGMHVLTKASNQLYGNPGPESEQHVAAWKQCGFTDLKLVTDGDSQLKAAKWLVQQGFRVLVRFYAEPIRTDAVPDDQLRAFRDVGVWAVEGYTNEPEIEWKRPPTPEVIDDLARAHICFADACGRVGGGLIPVTPAIQGDRVYSWFEPMVKRIIALSRRDALVGSYIGCHPRPVNNLPDTTPPGFVPRSYELFDDVVRDNLGASLPILATEWGYEPGDSNNAELPTITLESHAAYNVKLAQMQWRPCLEVCYYWTWLDDWFNSGWWRGDTEKSLPVVKAFIAMPKPGPVPPTPPPPAPTPESPIAVLRMAVQYQIANYPWGVKEALRRGYIPIGEEVVILVRPSGAWHFYDRIHPPSEDAVVWFAQPARRPSGSICLLIFKEGGYEAHLTTEIEFSLP